GKEGKNDTPPKTTRRRGCAEVAVTLDLTAAQNVAVPDRAGKRKPEQAVSRDDLEGLWAVGQSPRFAVLAALASYRRFYSFAQEATARKYGIPGATLQTWWGGHHPFVSTQLYETTTGAAAIAESLQLERMLNPNARARGERTVDITKVSGITIAEHPWEKMM